MPLLNSKKNRVSRWLNIVAIVARVAAVPRWLPVVVGVSTATVFLWQALIAQERAQIEQMILVESLNVKDEVTSQLKARTLALVRMGKRWENRGGTPKQEWESDALFNINDYGGYQAIEWVDPAFRVRWVVPRLGNEAAQNLNLASENRRRIALETARNQHQVTVTRSINLVQGGKGFRVYIPIFQGEDFRGFILGVFRIQQLLDTILAADENVAHRYSIAVFDGNEEIYSRNVISRQHEKEWGKETKINLYGVTWRVRVWPTPELLAEEQSPLPKVVLLGGLLMAWLLGLAIHLTQKTRFQQQQTEVSNQKLQNEIAERQLAEAALRQSEERFKAFMNNSPVMAFIKDAEGRYIYINKPFEHTFNVKLTDLQGKTDFDWLPEVTAKLLRENDIAVFKTNKSIKLIETVPTPEGYLNQWLSFKFIVEDVSGQRLLGGVAVDISERQEMEAALQQANEKLTDWVNELKQRNHEIVLLGEISDVLQACLTVEEAYSAISTMMQPLFPGTSGGIFLISASKKLVEGVATWGVSPLSSLELFTPDECWALRRGRVHLVENTHSGLLCNLVENTHSGLVCKHINPDSSVAESLCVPMMAQGEALGVLYLSSLKLGELTQPKQQLAVTIAEQISLALANLKLREMLQNQSIRDSLTGLFNRRYLEESLEREIHRAKRKQQSLGIIMLDVDHFKRFNDTFGHEAGDAVLRELGLLLKQYVRQSDIACRYGGEEFMLILPEASLDLVRQRAEQLRQGAKQLQVQHRSQSLGAIALSLGVACYPEHGLTGETVIRAADAALYCAKAEGRDTVRVAHL